MPPWLQSLADLRALFLTRANDDLNCIIIGRALHVEGVPFNLLPLTVPPVDKRPQVPIK